MPYASKNKRVTRQHDDIDSMVWVERDDLQPDDLVYAIVTNARNGEGLACTELMMEGKDNRWMFDTDVQESSIYFGPISGDDPSLVINDPKMDDLWYLVEIDVHEDDNSVTRAHNGSWAFPIEVEGAEDEW